MTAIAGKLTAAVLFVHNIGVELGLWYYGLTYLAGRGAKAPQRVGAVCAISR